MAGSTTLKNQIRVLKRRLDTPLGMLSFFAALITVCSFSIGIIEWIQKDLRKSEAVRWFTEGSGAEALMLVIYALVCLWVWKRCCQVMLRPRLRYRFDNCLWQGFGLQLLLALPAGLAQMLTNTPRLSMQGVPLWTRILIPLSHWPFNVGGLTVWALHHWSVGLWSRIWLVDSAETTARMAYLTVLTGIQGLLLAWLFTLRYRQIHRFKDLIILVGCGIFLVNSLAILALN